MAFKASGTEFAVNTTVAGAQLNPDIAALKNPSGTAAGYVSVWTDGSNAIRARLLDAEGKAKGGEILVNTPADAILQDKPAVAALDGGGFVVAWRSFQTGIVAQRFDASGRKVGEDLRINDADEAYQDRPTVSAVAGGGFAVTWDGRTSFTGVPNVFSQLVGANGVKIGAEKSLSASTDGFGALNSATAKFGNGYVSVWQDNSGTTSKIVAQAFAPSGEKSGASFTVATASNFVGSPTVAALKSGGYAIAWVASEAPGKFGVIAQRFGADGKAQGARVEVAAQGTNFTSLPDIAAQADGGFAVSWQVSVAVGDADVFARSFGADGKAAGSAFKLNTVTAGEQVYAELAAGADGRLVAIWKGQNGADFNIEGQAYTSDSIPPGTKPLKLAGDLKASVKAGGSTTLTAADLGTDDATGTVTYVVSKAVGGSVQFKGTNKAVSGFTQADLSAGKVVFVQAGNGAAASFSVAAKDSDETTAPKTFSLTVTKPAPEPDLVLAPRFDASSHFIHDGTAVRLRVVDLGGGTAVAVWDDAKKIKMQRLDEDGRPVGDVQTVDVGGVALTVENVLALKKGGRFVVNCSMFKTDDQQQDIEFVFDKSGKLIKQQVISKAGGTSVSIDATADGGFVASWQEHSDKLQNVFFQRFDSLGEKLGGPVKVASFDGLWDGGTLDVLSDGRILVQWKTGDAFGYSKGFAEMPQNFAQLFAKDGKAIGNPFAVGPKVKNVDTASAVALKDGAVAFLVPYDFGRKTEIYIRDKDGTTHLAPPNGPSQPLDARTGTLPLDGMFIKIFQDRDKAYVAQIYDDALALIDTIRPREVSGKPLFPAGTAVSGLPEGDFLLSWTENISRSKFDKDGGFTAGGSENWVGGRVLSFQNLVSGDGRANGLDGTSADDRLVGLGGADTLDGAGGNDVLVGGAGGDSLQGGLGTDAASYSTAAEGIGLNLETGANSGEADGDTFGSVERFVGSRHVDFMRGDGRDNDLDGLDDNDFLFGRAGDDTLSGGLGDDVLEGGLGADALYGGLGLDAASYANAEAGITASLANARLNNGEAKGDRFFNVESLIGSAFADRLSGDERANRLDGGEGDDRLAGGDEDDFLFGGGGDDMLEGGGGGDRLDGGAGSDTVSYANAAAVKGREGVTKSLLNTFSGDPTSDPSTGEAKGDNFFSVENITGSRFDDTLTGDSKANELTGGLGADVLSGGLGFITPEKAADLFIYNSVKDSGLKESERDTIRDFGENDRIDLRAVTGAGFDFADIRQTKTGPRAFLVEIDVDGKASYDMAIEVLEITKPLAEADFLF